MREGALNNKKIAYNTIMLYIRMLLVMAVSIYTTRVILEALGIIDYGVYNIVTTFVTFLSFITNALVSAMQRFFNVALGKNDIERYRSLFSMSINILLIISIIIILLGETIGLWFLNTQLDIPGNRTNAAFWVFQFSLLTFITNTLRTPYNASVIAHEKMAFYAYLSIFEVIMRLAAVFALLIIPFDRLITYSLLYLLLNILINLIFVVYCTSKFQGCKYIYQKDKGIFKELLSFSGWTLFGQGALIINNQGVMVIVNRTFTVVANAAMSIANQVTVAIDMFVHNFQTAFKPQLIQTYAANNLESHYKLIQRSSRFSYYLMLILLLPLSMHIDYVLTLWLGEYPEYTREFVIYTLISHLFTAISSPLITSIFATGKIKQYQISFAISNIVSMIAVFICLTNGFKPYFTAIIAIILQTCLCIIRLYYANKLTNMPYGGYIKKVVIPCIVVTALACVPTLFYNFNINSFITFVINTLGIVIYIGIIILLVGLDKTEKNYIIKKIRKYVKIHH